MTYEEAVANVLEVAGDYKKASSTHDIEVAICKKDISQLRDEIKDIVEKLSISPESIQLIVKDERILVKAFDIEIGTYKPLYELAKSKNVNTDFPKYVEQALRYFIRESSYREGLEIGDIQRFCGYARLVMSSITPEVIGAVSTAGNKLDKAKTALLAETKRYGDYCAALKRAMSRAANYWLLSLSITSGMKLSIIDLRSSEKKTEVRTVKRVRNQDGEVVLAFEGTASIVKGMSRIDALESWLINNPQFQEMANILKDSKIQKISCYFS